MSNRNRDNLLVGEPRKRVQEIIAEKLSKAVGVWAVSQVRITKADNFGLWPQREDAGRFIVRVDKMLRAFLELQTAIHAYAELS